MRVLLLLILSVCCGFSQSLVETFYRGGLGTPVSDHQLLTVTHLDAGYDDTHVQYRDWATQLMIVEYPAGTFSSWASISYDDPPANANVNVGVQRNGVISLEPAVVESVYMTRYIRTDGYSLVGGDSGSGMYYNGNLVGVGFANDHDDHSYFYSLANREDWLRLHISDVPEPSIMWLILIGGSLVWLKRRLL